MKRKDNIGSEGNTRKVGQQYEDVAAEYLENQGYCIMERNYRRRGGELDIVAKRDGMLIVCEVKYRKTAEQGSPLEAVDARKQMQISKMTAHYLVSHGYREEVPVRFDVIGIDGNGQIRHIENAFEYCYGR
ncbi:MAG: YraN family protein [Lachnospiraceae bacterium]|nr:YraN family protein [Lachnospiraceae bacterium]